MSSILQLPSSLHAFFSIFPLHSYPPILPPHRTTVAAPTLWIHPPTSAAQESSESCVLSADVECLKWQAYLALRGLSNIRVRWDVKPEGALDGRLPNLQLPPSVEADGTEKDQEKKLEADVKAELLPAHLIPSWADANLGASEGDLEGYKDEIARDESRAWVALLEGTVHAALILSQPPKSYLLSLLSPSTNPMSDATSHPLQTLLTPPPPPLTGISSFIPPSGTRISTAAIDARYREAMSSLSERLGTDKWFLGSSEPTALDALAFAYIHCILNSKDNVRIEVTRRVNLVAWEWRVRSLVRATFTPHP